MVVAVMVAKSFLIGQRPNKATANVTPSTIGGLDDSRQLKRYLEPGLLVSVGVWGGLGAAAKAAHGATVSAQGPSGTSDPGIVSDSGVVMDLDPLNQVTQPRV